MGLTPHEIAILQKMINSKREQTTRQISKKTGMKWATANKYLRTLYEKGYVAQRKTRGGTTYWDLAKRRLKQERKKKQAKSKKATSS